MRRFRLLWIGLVGVVVLVVDASLLFVFERIPEPVSVQGVIAVEERLRHLVYTSTRRRANLAEMGLNDAQAEQAAAWAERWSGERARLGALLGTAAGQVGPRVCPGGDLPQPYALLSVLVEERNGIREVASPDRLSELVVQPWALLVPVESIYRDMELEGARASDATALALAAVIGGRESELLDGRLGNRGFSGVIADDPSVEARLVRYLGFMHLVVEVANEAAGVCATR